MGKTISFVATDELAEWIEEESERRMTSVSSTAQQLLAERYHMDRTDEEPEDDELSGSEEGAPESKESEGWEDDGADEGGDADQGEGEGDDLPEIFRKQSDKWYHPDSDRGHQYAVRTLSGNGPKYYKTVDGAANRLREEYE